MQLFYNKNTDQFILFHNNRAFASYLINHAEPGSTKFADLVISRLKGIKDYSCKKTKVPAKVEEYVRSMKKQ